MSGDTGASAGFWHDDEVALAGLPDKRLARRFRRLLDQMSAAPGQSVPAACGDWAATKAAYRFFDNPRVTEHGMLAGHFAATAMRCAASEDPVLILQDTTEFIYSRAQPGKIGFTKTINAGRYKAGQPNKVTLCGVLCRATNKVRIQRQSGALPQIWCKRLCRDPSPHIGAFKPLPTADFAAIRIRRARTFDA